MPVPTVDDVDAITAMPDAASRNYRITDSYFQLSSAFAQWLSGGANWCTFATWASKQAGRTIRAEDVAQRLGRRIDSNPLLTTLFQRALQRLGLSRQEIALHIGEALLQLPAAQHASEAVARGNRNVFAEIGREFARFLAMAACPGGVNERRLAEFRDGLRPGDPPDGQRLLKDAFQNYALARGTSGSKARAARQLLANLQIGLHEQTRLQPEIREALNAPLGDLRAAENVIFLALTSKPPAILALKPLRDAAARELARVLAGEALLALRTLLTDRIMTLEFGDGLVVRLGADVGRGFPESLAVLDVRDIDDFLCSVDPTPDSIRDSGATDWGNLSERMHFIADLFRAYQEEPELMAEPFSPRNE